MSKNKTGKMMSENKKTISLLLISLGLIIILVITLCAQIISAAVNSDSIEQQVYASDELVISQHIGGEINVSEPQKLQQLQATLHLLPFDDYRQSVVEQNFSVQPQYLAESVATFKWNSPIKSVNDFSVDTVVRTRNTYQQVTKQVSYPILFNQIPEDAIPYLQFTDLIDRDSAISAKAQELAGNSNDEFVVAFNVAQWVANNIKYDLTTITADATQNATWVYTNREGVCDELSVLYMSMMRSLGIPARFVSGISYTNSPLFSYPWSPHAWVEVYFPGFGWVPFDLTYKQFGYIDAGHIAMQTSIDANDSATQYQWQGFGIDSVDVEPAPLSFTSTLLDARSQIDTFSNPTVKLLRDTVSLTSSSAIVVTLENTKNYYVSAQLSIGAPSELLFPNGQDIQLLLHPFEEKTVYIPVTIASGLSDRYTYKFPIVVTNFFQTLANTTLYVSSSNPTYSSDEINAMISNTQVASQSQINANVRPQCSIVNNANSNGGIGVDGGFSDALVNTTFSFVCDIQNIGNVPVPDLSVCVAGICNRDSLDAQSTHSFTYNLSYSTVGVKQIPVRLQIGSHIQESLIDITVTDVPAVSISVLDAPTTLTYDQIGNIKLLLEKKSFSSPQKTVVRIFNSIPYIWNVGLVQANKELTVSVSGSILKPGKNDVPITAVFSDANANQYSYSTSVPIELVGVTFWQRIVIWLKDLIS